MGPASCMFLLEQRIRSYPLLSPPYNLCHFLSIPSTVAHMPCSTEHSIMPHICNVLFHPELGPIMSCNPDAERSRQALKLLGGRGEYTFGDSTGKVRSNYHGQAGLDGLKSGFFFGGIQGVCLFVLGRRC